MYCCETDDRKAIKKGKGMDRAPVALHEEARAELAPAQLDADLHVNKYNVCIDMCVYIYIYIYMYM